jgi:multiple sugar transport system permease protein
MSKAQIMLEEKGKRYQMKLSFLKIFRTFICVMLCVLSLIPFWIMIVNATRSSLDIQSSFSIVPSKYLLTNLANLNKQNTTVPIWRYMFNSCLIAFTSTCLCVYFSTMTAYGISVYRFKGRNLAWSFILGIMMIPMQVSAIGFYKFMFQAGFGNSYVPLIIPAIAAPSTVFFMKQYMQGSLSLEIIEAARIDGSSEFSTFNRIAIPLMKPAVATQAIFAFIASWNNFFTPSMILSTQSKWTLPMFVQVLRSERFRSDYGIIYVGLVLTVVPIIIVYLCLSKYIIAGVALGGVKE